ncbi:hypothetical protein OH786_28320 [Streptomyces atratus]|uniref:PEP-CTERM protein-sorting domain-containing protein n=1 Tax=Streptomyces atratus TaxID=1893 RepID=A0A1K2BZ32_STRAR|nr:hypothetical protein [Streptomyces atratus]SFY03380.1 PEP-CTERM protein-sorting domain-containing protein [Streptomyces atratus]
MSDHSRPSAGTGAAVIGLDLGGMKIAAALLGPDARPLSARISGMPFTVSGMAAGLSSLFSWAGVRRRRPR